MSDDPRDEPIVDPLAEKPADPAPPPPRRVAPVEEAEPAPPPASDPDPDAVNEASLFFGISSQRLRRRARWAGALLLLSALLPHEFVDTSPLFLWDTLPELPIAAVVGSLAMPAAGLAILLASVLAKRATSLAVLVLTSFALVAVMYTLGGDRAAWDVFSMPESVSSRPAPALFALVLTASGAALAFRPGTRKLGRGLLVASVASALFFYLWPTRGEAPMSTLVRAFVSLPDLPSFRFQIGMLLLASIVLWPLFVSLLGLVYVKTPPRRDDPWLTVLATFGLPALLLMFAYRALIFAQAGLALLAYTFTILVVTGILALLSSAIVVAAEGASLNEAELEHAHRAQQAREIDPDRRQKRAKRTHDGLSLRTAAIVGATAFFALSITEWVLARPPKKGVEWQLSGATPEADRVYGSLFADWDHARRTWDSDVRHEASASGHLAVRKSAKDLGEAAKALDPKLAEAFLALTTESDDLDLAGRRFFRLIEDVNEASRKARLPYYIDPNIAVRESKEGVQRFFYASAFRIESVNRWDVDGRDFAALVVRPVSGGRTGHGLLGFSRDVQPFALVDLDEIEPYRADLEAAAQSKVCTTKAFPAPRSERAFSRCGEILADLVAESAGGVRDALELGTERHELQHQIDGPHLAMSSAVLERLGAYVPSFQDRVNRELSAYVAELTAEGLAPKLELVHLAQFVLGERGGAYHHASVIVFEALSGKKIRHGVEPEGEVDFDVFEDVLSHLATLSDDELRAKGRDAYAKLFNAKLVSPTRIR